jgi:predicted glycosyltransferase
MPAEIHKYQILHGISSKLAYTSFSLNASIMYSKKMYNHHKYRILTKIYVFRSKLWQYGDPQISNIDKNLCFSVKIMTMIWRYLFPFS